MKYRCASLSPAPRAPIRRRITRKRRAVRISRAISGADPREPGEPREELAGSAAESDRQLLASVGGLDDDDLADPELIVPDAGADGKVKRAVPGIRAPVVLFRVAADVLVTERHVPGARIMGTSARAPALGPRRRREGARDLEVLLTDLRDEPRELRGGGLPEGPACLGRGEIEPLPCARHADVGEASLLLDLAFALEGPRVRAETLLQADRSDEIELQSLRAVERHQIDSALSRDALSVADQRRPIEEPLKPFRAPRLPGGVDELGDVFETRLGLRFLRAVEVLVVVDPLHEETNDLPGGVTSGGGGDLLPHLGQDRHELRSSGRRPGGDRPRGERFGESVVEALPRSCR